jgi:hypothetical protein
VGFFSFPQKNTGAADTPAPTQPLAPPAGQGAPNSRLRAGEPSRPMSEEERARQREIARATAAKIDAIELAMTNDIFNTPEPAWGSGPRRPRTNAQMAGADSGSTLPLLELATTELLADDGPATQPHQKAAPQTPPVLEEIAILYANGQLDIAEQMLQASLRELGQVDRSVWWMLFDLYQISARQDEFDSIAIDYASRFETSPPSWTPLGNGTPQGGFAGVTPTEAFTGVLDASCAARIGGLPALARQHPVLRLEFAHITAATADGCALLLGALQQLGASGCELIVAGAAELAELLRGSIEIGRRDSGEAPWLLLLELLQWMNLEKDFEETAMDYCITFEVSPPSFVAPVKVATSARADAPQAGERFMLPPQVAGENTALLAAIDAYAAGAAVVVIVCARLARFDYAAALALLNRLRPLAAGKKIELRDVNHLVAALLKLLGFGEVARLFPHRY